ncbi:MAG: DUF2933 domain-containing protein [Chloroflexi bacterium]|nr:DUF2933 domain-containing protein [Chloroflexota bacterium]
MRTFIQSRTGLVLIVFLAIAGFFLVTEHTAHLFGLWPFAFLFLCVGMHFFMHGGHGDASDEGHIGHEGHIGREGHEGHKEPTEQLANADKSDQPQGGGVS